MKDGVNQRSEMCGFWFFESASVSRFWLRIRVNMLWSHCCKQSRQHECACFRQSTVTVPVVTIGVCGKKVIYRM